MKALIPYYRVSTTKQERSGLGLEAQQATVERFAQLATRPVLPAFTEAESGKLSSRPQLAAALQTCKARGATLIVAKLDRLSRNVAFLSQLLESDVEIVFADMPNADRFTLHILAAVAEKEAKDISTRTKAALAAYKARGGLLGAQLPKCRNLTDAARRKGNRASRMAIQQQTAQAYAHVLPMIQEMRQAGETLQAIADRLNAEGYTTRQGKIWKHVQVRAILLRAE
jgi:DNA invertase Pin-like site-specific DNA recombinase